MARPSIQIRRVYEAPGSADGFRVLVDRLWPRGMSKQAAGLDEWCKQVAPSGALRKWYAHDRTRFEDFRRRYRDELRSPETAQAVQYLRQLAAQGAVTLVTATKDIDISAASVLAEVLRHQPLPAQAGSPQQGDPCTR